MSEAKATRLGAAEVLLARGSDRERARWPSRGPSSRLEPFAQPILVPKFRFRRSDRIFTMGSCFARNVEEHLAALGFDVPTLQFRVPEVERPVGRASGILNKFTPPSMLQEITRAAEFLDANSEEERHRLLAAPLYEVGTDAYLDLELVSKSAVSCKRALARRSDIAALHSKMFECEVVVLTLGLVEAWFDAKTRLYIHQAPSPRMLEREPDRFFFELLSYDKCLRQMRQALDLLNGRGSEKRILVTVSPVPLRRTFQPFDVLVANTAAKSLLRGVCDQLNREYENIDYFPSYEMALLSRDPALWTSDLIHLTDEGVGRIVDHMIKAYVGDEISDGERAILRAWDLLLAAKFDAAVDLACRCATGPEAELIASARKGASQANRLEALHAMAGKLAGEHWVAVAQAFAAVEDDSACLVALQFGESRPFRKPVARYKLAAAKAECLLRLGRVDDARVVVAQHSMEECGFPMLLAAARVSARSGGKAESKRLLEKALDKGPRKASNRAALLVTVAEIQLENGDAKDARQSLRRALRYAPDHPAALRLLMEIKARHGTLPA